MTPLGSSTFELIFTRSTTPERRRGAALDLWATYGQRACLYASNFATACLVAAVESSEEGRQLYPAQPDDEELGGLDPVTARAVGEATWNHLAGRILSYQMNVRNPVIEDELQQIGTQYEGDAVQLFAHWGRECLEDLTKLDQETLDATLDWIEQEFERIDLDLHG